jgi:uncharacterized membrane protein YphA (DoxX/SURF4 family)
MLLRRIARPLLASWFFLEGVDAVRFPTAHAERAAPVLNPLSERLPISIETRRLAQAHGAALVGAAIMLAIGKAPRTAAVALAALTAPVAVVGQPFWSCRDPQLRADYLHGFIRDIGMIGGALVAAADTEGRPGLTWRFKESRARRAPAAERTG